jgi:peptidoglycan/LPS O-acetylase OafA/YrhL
MVIAKKRTGYLPSLDGWRAIAICGVLFLHEEPLHMGGYSLAPFQRLGSFGVTLFFAISGVLIAHRILEEEALSGHFDLKRFYVRRLFRIQPCMWVYLSVIAILTLSGVLHEAWIQITGALLMFTNFQHRNHLEDVQGWFTGHFWTLSVEEHFYLLISLSMFYVRKHRTLVFGIALLLIKALQVLAKQHAHEILFERRTYWIVHALLWPSWIAMLLNEPGVRPWCERWMKPWLVVGGIFLLAALSWLFYAAPLVTLLTYGLPLCLVATMLHKDSLTTRVLECSPLRFVGRLSYSLYVWHVLFYAGPELHQSAWLNALSTRPWKYVVTLSVALGSYYLIEKPMIRLGHRLAPPATAGHRDLA